jgi:hypothetical protein
VALPVQDRPFDVRLRVDGSPSSFRWKSLPAK